MNLGKGHGTGNDFLLLLDPDGAVDLRAGHVRALCDRRTGIGADGVLRAIRTARLADAAGLPDADSLTDPDGATDGTPAAEWFMDYRNADGSIAEMCGNGIRVFHAYLSRAGLVEPDAAVATRGGIRRVRASGDGNVTVDMGLPRFLADRPIVTAAPLTSVSGVAVELPNPHVVVAVPDPGQLESLDLDRPPAVTPALPHGQNVEFVVRTGPRRVQMRVHERGVGETRSCGTGICAAAVVTAHREQVRADGIEWQVDVPGGTCWVRWLPDGSVSLTGPAVLVGTVDVDDAWLAAAAGSW